MAKKNITIAGKVINQNKKPLPNLCIEAWDKDLLIDDFLGETITDSNGEFKISFSQNRFKELFIENWPDLYFKIYAGKTLIHSTEKSVLWNISMDQENLIITINTKGLIKI
jgi:hypothetical protein